MSVEEYLDLMSASGMYNEHFFEREARYVYAMSMTTVEDEMATKRHTRMKFLEFLEAVRGCAAVCVVRCRRASG